MRRTSVLLPAGLLAAACSGGSPAAHTVVAVTASGPPDAQVARVDGTAALRFVPGLVRARTGRLTLTLGNVGGTPHNLHFDDPSLPPIGLVGAGVTRAQTYTFTRPGTYGFVCTIHAGMSGQVVVS